MKTLTKMKKVCCLSRFVLLVMALGRTSIFTSCSSDDDENIPVYSLKDVEGTYSGKMQTTSIAPLENAENEAEDGVTVNAELKDNHILISKFPVEDLIKSNYRRSGRSRSHHQSGRRCRIQNPLSSSFQRQ